MRAISFSMTTEAAKARTKTVTRRLRWLDLRPDEMLQAVEKGQGLKKGEHVKAIGIIRVVKVTKEPLYDVLYYSDREMANEGFPGMSRDAFVEMFVKANRCQPTTQVTRIEFEWVERLMLDGSPCFCKGDAEPHEGWQHSPTCSLKRNRRLS